MTHGYIFSLDSHQAEGLAAVSRLQLSAARCSVGCQPFLNPFMTALSTLENSDIPSGSTSPDPECNDDNE